MPLHKLKNLHNDALAVKEQSPSAQAKVDERRKLLKAKADPGNYSIKFNNLQQIREPREVELKMLNSD